MNAAVLHPTSTTSSKETPMTDILAHAPRPAVRSTGPSTVTMVGLEIRKSLSTRSGKAVALASALLAPAAIGTLALSGDPLESAAFPIAIFGMVTGLLLLALGVLSSAGEWTHRTVQTTFLQVPSRTKVIVAKSVAMGVLGAVLAGIAAVSAAGVLSVAPVGDPSWFGVPNAIMVAVAAGAAFAVIGAGVGAAMANTPAALTTVYLTVLGVMPVLRSAKPEIAEMLDPSDAVLQLGLGQGGNTQWGVLIGWVLVTSLAGVVITRRRAVS
jgi:hypothetical protein